MIVGILIGFVIGIAAIGAIIYVRILFKKLQALDIKSREYDEGFEKVVERAREIQLTVDFINKSAAALDKEREHLEERLVDISIQEARSRERESLVNSKLEENREVIKLNEALLKKHAVDLFHLKETAIVIYDHYVKVKSFLEEISKGNGIDQKSLFEFQDRIDESLKLVDGYFQKTFNLSCNQYKKMTTNIVGNRRSGGSTFISESGLN